MNSDQSFIILVIALLAFAAVGVILVFDVLSPHASYQSERGDTEEGVDNGI
jgi:hypothetical protein